MHGFYSMVRIVPDLPAEVRREQVRFPRSKRKRIRRKWAKKSVNWTETVLPVAFRLGGVVLVNKPMFDLLHKELPSSTARLYEEIAKAMDESYTQHLPERAPPSTVQRQEP